MRIRNGLVLLLIWVFGGASPLPAANYVGPAQPQDALDRWYLRSTAQLTRVRYVGNLFVGLGTNGVLMTSPDGTTWTARNSGTTASLTEVAYGTVPTPTPHNLFVVVGSGGTILLSSDGTNWNPISATTQDLNDVAWNGNQFVATTTANSSTQRNVLWSANGITWSGATFPGNPDTGFPFITSALGVVDGYFITAGGSEFAYYIWRSSNGSSWQNVGFSDAVVTGVAAGNGRSLIVGWEGWPRVSTNDGASWFASASSVITPNAYQPPYYAIPMVGSDVAFGNGTFVVPRSFLQNGLLVTTGALTWTKRDLFLGASIESMAYGNGTFVLVCSGGAYPAGIYQSESSALPIIGISLQTNPKAILLNISGEVGRAYRLQISPDLQSWSDYLIYTNTAPTFQFLDPVATGSTQLFYRVVSP